jgi:hypothetical protein
VLCRIISVSFARALMLSDRFNLDASDGRDKVQLRLLGRSFEETMDSRLLRDLAELGGERSSNACKKRRRKENAGESE